MDTVVQGWKDLMRKERYYPTFSAYCAGLSPEINHVCLGKLQDSDYLSAKLERCR